MKSRAPGVTVVVQRDGATRSRTMRLPLWALRFGALGGAAFLAAVVLLAILYFPVVRAAARVPGLERKVDRLEAENAMVRQLSAALDSAEMRYEQLRRMIGADIVRDPLAISASLPLAPALRARVGSEPRPPGPGPTVPREWPLAEAGYVTRGQVQLGSASRDEPHPGLDIAVPTGTQVRASGGATVNQVGAGTRDEPHPGLDIAVPVGTMVRASGGATVNQIGDDPEYGYYVLLDHPEEYQTMYGHLSRIIVTDGQTLQAGEVIGLSGNSGRSTAPHLHFEIRQRGTSLDPRTMVKQGG